VHFVGSITAVDMDRWAQLIARHSQLAPVLAREGVDPFTRAPFTYRAHPGDARVVVAGKARSERNDRECAGLRHYGRL
jgi:hypothetical protein